MRVLHAYCLNYNLGDHALGIGVKNVLRHCLPIDFIAETNLQGQVFDDDFISRLNQNFDLVVIGGGGIIHGHHWPQGWFWLVAKDNIQKIRIPFIVYAAGYNYFRGEKPIPERGIEHLRETQSRAAYFSVRNDGSYERLRAETGIQASIIADPGFWVSLDRKYVRPLRKPYVMVQLADDKPALRYGAPENRARFVDNMRAIIRHLSHRYAVVLSPHVLADVALCREVAMGLDRAKIWDFRRYAFDRTQDCLGYYQHASFVLAMRGHGQILPLGFNVPVISLENHDKNIGLMRNIGLEKYNVSIDDSELVDQVIALSEGVAEDTTLRQKIRQNCEQMYADTMAQFEQISRLIGAE